MKSRALAAVVLITFGAAGLFWNLGRPALWQDEAETAIRAQTILETGLPRMSLHGILATAQPSLSDHEGNASGVWMWNTWLPAYLAAGSFAVFGATPFAARLPFALAGLATLWLFWRLFDDEAALALLALSPAFLLFCRQSRYYALVALGTMLALHAWKRLLADKRHAAWMLALSLQFLLHASFAFFAATALALALDAMLRGPECPRERRYWLAAGLTLVMAAPAAWYFRIWDRPGNHAYGFFESLEFLKTFLLWLAAFSVPLTIVAAAARRRWVLVVLGFALLSGLVSEGAWSLACAAAVWIWILAAAAREPAAEGELNRARISLLLIAASLGLLSFGAAEPYGRYLAGILPAAAFLTARAIGALSSRRIVKTALVAATVSCNLLFLIPLKAAQFVVAPRTPADTVSGMMRARLRDLSPRSDLALFARETARGADGYVEAAAAAMRAGGGETFFSDADTLSLMFASPLRPVYPDELKTAEPDWILPSPWISLSPEIESRVRALAASGHYEILPVDAPLLMWQNNPDPLFRDFSSRRGPLPLMRRVHLFDTSRR